MLGVPVGVSIGLAGLALMSPEETRWWIGYALAWIGFGSVPVLMLLFYYSKVTCYRVLRRDGVAIYLSRRDIWAIARSNAELLAELKTLNPDLEEAWMMDPEFPPFLLRSVTQFWLASPTALDSGRPQTRDDYNSGCRDRRRPCC